MSEEENKPKVIQLDNLEENLSGGKVIDFVYDRSLNSIVSDWTARVYGGTFTAGNTITFKDAMTNGYILRAYVDSDGFWQLSGKDAGVKLMRTLPLDSDGKDLSTGGIKTLIGELASFCGLSVVYDNQNMTEAKIFNKIYCRCLISGKTCAEAITELALYAGWVCYIGNDGKIHVTTVDKSEVDFDETIIIEDNNSMIDCEGYADCISINIARENKDETDRDTIGTRPSFGEKVIDGKYDVADQSTYFDGIDDILDDYGKKGVGLTGKYTVTIQTPFGFIKKNTAKVTTDEGLEISIDETHNYDIKSKYFWRGEDDEDQTEIMMVAYAEKDYTITKTTKGTYKATHNGEEKSFVFTETTKEEMKRHFSKEADGVNELSVPYNFKEEWSGWDIEILPLAEETILKKTTRTGLENDPIPNDDYPLRAYSPPFDSNLRRVYRRVKEHRDQTMIICSEVEITYKLEEVHAIAAIRYGDELFNIDKATATVRPLDPDEQSASNDDGAGVYQIDKRIVQIDRGTTEAWVAVYNYKITFDRYDRHGNPIYTATYSWNDGGKKWYLQNGMFPKDTSKMSEVEQLDYLYEQCYAKFTAVATSVQVAYGQSSITTPWTYTELEGRKKITYNKRQGIASRYISDIEQWFDMTKKVLRDLEICPFYNGGACTIYPLHDFPGQETASDCYYEDGNPWPTYRHCARAVEAAQYVKKHYGRNVLVDTNAVKAVAGETTTNSSGFEDFQFTIETPPKAPLTDSEAQTLADTLAQNILDVKKSKGVMKISVVPYETKQKLGKAIRGIRYDWGNLRTEYTYFAEDGSLPEFLGTNIANLSAWAYHKEDIRKNRVILGKVTEIDEDGKYYTVMIRGSEKIQCISGIGNNVINVDDTVMINRSSGFFGKGEIISLL